MRHHHDARRRGRIVFRQDRAAEQGTYPENLEVVAGDDFTHRQPRPVVEVERREHRAVTDHPVEHFVLRLEIEIVGIRSSRW